jgi:hypothetical protein
MKKLLAFSAEGVGKTRIAGYGCGISKNVKTFKVKKNITYNLHNSKC